MLQPLLREELIQVPLTASSFEGAFVELIAKLPHGLFPARQKAELLELLLQREFFESTAVGDQMALPHCVLPGLLRPCAILGVSRKGIDYAGFEREPVHLVFLSVFPETASLAERYGVLEDIRNLLKEPFLRERLKICETPEEVFEILIRAAQPALPRPQLKYRA